MDQMVLGMIIGEGSFLAGAASMLLLQGKPRRKQILQAQGAVPAEDHRDEFLAEKDGAFVPLNPPEYVPDGVHPTHAARHRSRAEGQRYSTRRVAAE